MVDEKILLEILEHIPSAVYVVDQQERMVYVNRAAELLDNYSRKDVLGKKLEDIYKDIVFTEDKNSPCLLGLHTGQVYRDENVEWFNGGKVINTLISTYLVREKDKIAAVYAICDEISNLKKRVISNASFLNQTTYKTHSKRLGNGTEYVFDDILGNSKAMQDTVSLAKRFAAKQMPVMLFGETGTGKEMFAQSIHNASVNYKGPFVAVNCAAIPDNLLESTLFGTKKGAFTGAVDSIGMFEKAENGTLFLDEINSMPIYLQSKLLRVLQEKEIQRLGDVTMRKINCRIISATNELPDKLMEEGRMREDLYYRLSTGFVFIPPLREREYDLDLLIQVIVNRLNQEMDTVIIGLTPALNMMMHQYNWPGNIRELTNVLASAFNFVSERDGYVGIEHLPNYLRDKLEESLREQGESGQPFLFSLPRDSEGKSRLQIDRNLNDTVDQFERRLIEQALYETKGKLSRCSERLGISRQGLSVKLKKYQINPAQYR